MSPTSPLIRAIAALLLSLTVLPWAYGQDSPAQPAAAAPAAVNGTTADTPPQPVAKPSAAAAHGKQPPVCFKLTMHCVEAKPGKDGTGSKAAPAGKPMNLNAPDIQTVVSPEELKEPLPSTEQQVQAEEDSTVEVKTKNVPPEVMEGFGAIWWALNHPSQAWRILAPAQ